MTDASQLPAWEPPESRSEVSGAPSPNPAAPVRPGPNVVALVWGLLLLALAGGAAVDSYLAIDLDPVLILAGVLAMAGLVFVGSAVSNARRRRPGAPARP